MDKDNVQHGTIPNEQSQTGSDTYTKRCPHTFEDAVMYSQET